MQNVPYSEESIFIVFSVLAISVNKYVLSTLHFTVPTVFQGWQTAVCVSLLTGISKWTRWRTEWDQLDQLGYVRLTIPVLAFTLTSVAGSKALANLPIAIFVAGTNSITAALAFIDMDTSTAGAWRQKKITGSFSICATLLIIYHASDFADIAWFWLLIHILSYVTYVVTISPLRLHPTTSVYYCNFSSLVILLPLSIYLQEAHSALNHAMHAKLEFYVGCVLSGVLGTGVQLLLGRLTEKKSVHFYNGVAKISSCTVSLICFSNTLSLFGWFFVIINLVVGCFVFGPDESKASGTGKGQEQTSVV